MIYARIPRYDTTEEDSMTDVPERTPDGRRSRRGQSRLALLVAGVELLLAGNFRPSDKQIVAKADRSLRTFYALFGTTEDYWMEVFRTYEQSVKAKVAQTLTDGDGFTLLRLILLGKV